MQKNFIQQKSAEGGPGVEQILSRLVKSENDQGSLSESHKNLPQ